MCFIPKQFGAVCGDINKKSHKKLRSIFFSFTQKWPDPAYLTLSMTLTLLTQPFQTKSLSRTDPLTQAFQTNSVSTIGDLIKQLPPKQHPSAERFLKELIEREKIAKKGKRRQGEVDRVELHLLRDTNNPRGPREECHLHPLFA